MVPKLLSVNIVDGVGESTLKGANLPQKWNAKGELVARIVGSADGAERSDINVECGEMVEGELSFFGGNGGKGDALVYATVL